MNFKSSISPLLAALGLLHTTTQAAPIVVQPGTAAGYMYFPAQINVQASGGGGSGGGSGIPPCNNLCQVGALLPGQYCLTPEGGVVRFVSIYDGNKILVTTLNDQGSAQWATSYVDEVCLTNWSSAPTTDFSSNATCLNSYGSARPAQKMCADIPVNNTTLGSGWRLPSGGELQLLYNNRTAIGGFSTFGYWSSAERDSNYAWYLYFAIGDWQYYYDKTRVVSVRCVRSF